MICDCRVPNPNLWPSSLPTFPMFIWPRHDTEHQQIPRRPALPSQYIRIVWLELMDYSIVSVKHNSADPQYSRHRYQEYSSHPHNAKTPSQDRPTCWVTSRPSGWLADQMVCDDGECWAVVRGWEMIVRVKLTNDWRALQFWVISSGQPADWVTQHYHLLHSL